MTSDEPTAALNSDEPLATLNSEEQTATLNSEEQTAALNSDEPTATSDNPTATLNNGEPTAALNSVEPKPWKLAAADMLLCIRYLKHYFFICFYQSFLLLRVIHVTPLWNYDIHIHFRIFIFKQIPQNYNQNGPVVKSKIKNLSVLCFKFSDRSRNKKVTQKRSWYIIVKGTMSSGSFFILKFLEPVALFRALFNHL